MFQGREEHKIKMALAGWEARKRIGEKGKTTLELQERKMLLAEQP